MCSSRLGILIVAPAVLGAVLWAKDAPATIMSRSLSFPAGQVLTVSSLPNSGCVIVQARRAEPLAPAEPFGFQGPDDLSVYVNNAGDAVSPPDSDLAVGPNHVVAVVNRLVTIYSKTGSCLYQTSVASWFSNVANVGSYMPCMSATQSCKDTDPRIAYDPRENRWILIALHKNLTIPTPTSTVLLSISQTSDPTGNWWNWALEGKLNFAGNDTRADFPDVGFDNLLATQTGAVYVTTNQFRFSGGQFETAALYILPKSALYAGTGFTCWQAYNPLDQDNQHSQSLRAAKMFGNGDPLNPVEYLVNTGQVNPLPTPNYVSTWKIVPTYPPTAVSWTAVPAGGPPQIGNYLPPTAAREPANCPYTIDTISLDNRLYNALWLNGRLYSSLTVKRSGTMGFYAGVRYFAIDTSNFTVPLVKSEFLDSVDYYFPAISADASGNIVVVHARSSGIDPQPAGYPSVVFTGQKTTESAPEPIATLQTGRVCVGDPGGAARWGDYFGAALDPSDQSQVWMIGSFSKDAFPSAPSAAEWGTWIGRVTFGPEIQLSCSPAKVALLPNGMGSATCTVTSLNGFTGSATLGLVSIPSGLTFSFMPNPVSVPAGGSAMTTLSLDGTAVPVGTYPMDVEATGSFNAQVAKVELDVGVPAIASISPQSGTTAGGTAITLMGGNFSAPAPIDFFASQETRVPLAPSNPLTTTVMICNAPAAVNSVMGTMIQATTGPHAEGPCDVVVTNASGSGTLKNGFNYVDCATEMIIPTVTAPAAATVTQTLCQ